jgi:apolipoprotein N-acyltransferase
LRTRRLLALAAGAACYALALPPFDVWPLAWGTLLPLIIIASAASPRVALAYGAIAGFATSWTVTWWLTQAVSSYFAANIALGVTATCAAYVLAVSTTFGLFAFGTALLPRALPRLVRPFVVAALWVTCEFVRGRLLGDPWALLGYTQYRVLPLIQLAAGTGVYGISYVVALGNAALAEAVVGRQSRAVRPRAPYVPLAAVAAVLLAGAAALRDAPTSEASFPVAVVQTNVPPAFRWDRRYAERQLDRVLHLTAEAVQGGPSLVVWPENALSLYLDHEPLLLESLRTLATERHLDLLVGGPRYADGRTYNSAYVIDARDGRLHVYDKQHLVPAAEAPIIPPESTQRDESPRSFTAGRRPGILRTQRALGVSICHEILYPDAVLPAVAEGATLLVNIANDGWLDGGYGVASRQHFAMAVFRAVEARRYLVRAATTGVSGIVDPWGRIVRSAPPGVASVLEARVEPRHGTTLYVRYGDWFPLACMLGIAVLALWRVRAARRLAPVGLPAPTLT